MNSDLIRFVLAFLLPPVVVFLLQSILLRAVPTRSPQFLTMAAMIVGYGLFFLMVGILDFSCPRTAAFYIYLFLLYSFSAYTYFHVFNMSETSRRVRMLNMISSQKINHVKELESIYDDGEMINIRLQRLVSLGQIYSQNGEFFPKRHLFTNTAVLFFTLGRLLSRPWPPMKKFIDERKERLRT